MYDSECTGAHALVEALNEKGDLFREEGEQVK
jgi:hypothetical protein